MNQRLLSNVGIFLALIVLIVAGRYLPHAANFTPAAAAGLFAAFWFRNRLVAVAVPLTGMLLSDILIQQYYPWATMAVVYTAMTLPALMGSWLFRNPSRNLATKFVKVGAGAVGSSLIFFILTNLAVWLFDGLYAMNWTGFVACYSAAIPFFRFSLAGDLFFAFAIFGSHALVTRLIARHHARVAGL
ncbi:MAG: DUF6580 family putative transport protein [Bacteroidia bacterium]